MIIFDGNFIQSTLLVEFGLEVYNRSDLDVCFSKFVPSLVGVIPQEVFVDGGISPSEHSLPFS